MKNIFLTFVLLCTVAVSYSQTENKKDSVYFKNHVYLNPFDLLFKTFTITYERNVNANKNSVAINGGILLQKTNQLFDQGFNAELQYRINLFEYKSRSKSFLTNIFFAPYFQFRYIDHEETAFEYPQYDYTTSYPYKPIDPIPVNHGANMRGYGAGVVMGLKATTLNNRLCFGFYGGGGAKYTDVKGYYNAFGNGDIIDENYTGIIPKFGVQMGMSF